MARQEETRTDRGATAQFCSLWTARAICMNGNFSAGYIRTTNNRMELMAVIAGLEALTKPCRVEIVSDSKYVTDAFNKKMD